jgi:hypothetical protein
MVTFVVVIESHLFIMEQNFRFLFVGTTPFF